MENDKYRNRANRRSNDLKNMPTQMNVNRNGKEEDEEEAEDV
jgi:hypothetical protein